jgi:ADP-ribose pyrophosphatase YjhB (NUDIX family)
VPRRLFFKAFYWAWRRTPRRLRRVAVWAAIPRSPVGAAVVLFDRDGRLLLVRPAYERGNAWTLPGGWAKRGEDLDAAARREAREELGIDVVVRRPAATARGPFREVSVAFEAEWRGEPALGPLDAEIAEARFFPVDALPPLSGPARRLVYDALAAREPRDVAPPASVPAE